MRNSVESAYLYRENGAVPVLEMTINNTTPPQTFVMGPNTVIDSGYMSDCTSLIILYNIAPLPPAGTFNNAVGQHAGGGPGNLNLPGIIGAVPAASRATARLFIVTGTNYCGEGFMTMNNTAVRATKTALQAAGFRIIQSHYSAGRALVDAAGTITRG